MSSFSRRETVFWIRFARWLRGSTVPSQWPGYRELLHDQCVWLITHEVGNRQALERAHDMLTADKKIEEETRQFAQDTLF